ncbi:MAG: DNA mismatch repair endonuclease MutL [Kangiellaceae bacterium]|nr:DNA mismatch repair endonuclease MutL [Kangiellaceae bacterium]
MPQATQSPATSAQRIKLLDNRLANQIAAGEVVERPASVVKELVENSIDSGATKIDVEIERGGTRLIRVTDNGKGIVKDDLTLALTRHATSKIAQAKDLAGIRSLGFRGEALASISSVAKLTLTSRPHQEELAWQAIAHGRDMAVEVLPAAASAGTRIEVAELFYNTPARQKFLRTEKTEFARVEEVFKQHALANPEIAFVLRHNHKVAKRVPATQSSELLKRVEAICGKPFAQNCIAFNCQHELMKVNGWLGKPDFHRSESDIQYVFINGRPIKDKILSHAIRQAYQQFLPPGRMATFVIFIQMDPHQLDVNVHPTKHEVRFGQQRLVHDLFAKSISEALNESFSNQSLVFEQEVNEEQAESDGRNQQDHLWQKCDDKQPTQALTQTSEIQTSETRTSDSDFNRSAAFTTGSSPYIRKVSQDTLKAVAAQKGIAGEVSNSTKTETNPELISQIKEYPSRVDSYTENKFVTPQQKPKVAKRNEAAYYVGGGFWIAPDSDGVLLAINQQKLLILYLQELVDKNQKCESKPLLFPIEVSVCEEVIEDFQNHQLLKNLGFIFEPTENSCLKISAVPDWSLQLSTNSIKVLLEDCFLSSLKTAGLIGRLSEQVELSPTQIVSIFHKCAPNLPADTVKQITGEMLKGLF